MGRASNDSLNDLHGLQAEVLLAQLRAFKNGEVKDADGNVLPIPPALLAQVNKFLKDNGVDRAVIPGDPTDLLNDEVPEFEDNVVNINGDR